MCENIINLPEIIDLLKEYNKSSTMTLARKKEIENIIQQWLQVNSNSDPCGDEFSWVVEVSNKFRDIQEKKYNPVTINTVLYKLLGMNVGTEEQIELIHYCMENRTINQTDDWVFEHGFQEYFKELQDEEAMKRHKEVWLKSKQFEKMMKIARYMKQHHTTIYPIWRAKKH